MEHNQAVSATLVDIADYKPNDYECERASNSYLMSVVAIIIGTPLPIVNLLATFFFYLGNRRSTPFVRWHCTQALLSQLTIFIMNTVAFAWTLRILFGGLYLNDDYIAYILTVIGFNIFEFIITVIAAIRLRKGKHTEWWMWGELTNELMGNHIPVNKYHG